MIIQETYIIKYYGGWLKFASDKADPIANMTNAARHAYQFLTYEDATNWIKRHLVAQYKEVKVIKIKTKIYDNY